MSSTANDNQTRMGPPDTKAGIPYDIAISGLVKSLRRGDERQAVRFVVDLSESNYERATWRRLLISVCEDHGLAAPGLAAEVNALHAIYEKLTAKKDDKSRAWRLPLIQATLAIARSPKSRIVDHCLIASYEAPEPPEVLPFHLDKHTVEGRRQGASWSEFWTEGTLLADPETGELGYGSIPDPYRDRAIAAVQNGRVSTLKQGQQTLPEHER